ncbi:hypothetical protein KEM55_008063 [Ascosphaera atra]|nr:hypothetical protein KEM55_008063 [Ascosphaera atra]
MLPPDRTTRRPDVNYRELAEGPSRRPKTSKKGKAKDTQSQAQMDTQSAGDPAPNAPNQGASSSNANQVKSTLYQNTRSTNPVNQPAGAHPNSNEQAQHQGSTLRIDLSDDEEDPPQNEEESREEEPTDTNEDEPIEAFLQEQETRHAEEHPTTRSPHS